MILQLDLVKKIQRYWADNAVSVTVYYTPEELDKIKECMKQNYEKHLKSVSFLLHSKHGFKQAPYEEIDEDRYKSLRSKIKPVSEIKIFSGDVLEGLECEGGACLVK